MCLIFVYSFICFCFSCCDVGSSEEEFEEQELKTVPGLFPLLSNVAVNSSAWSNATCGTERPEEYCKMIEMQKIKTQCGICDSKSPDATKGHPITHILSESTSTWQSPTLENGLQYNWVTVTLDLKQVRRGFFTDESCF